jgi:hypothetical protein
MSHGSHAGNRRKGSGRVTPSKLRRTAVVAADGVLAIGTGALGGLFVTAGGPASATAPTTGWAATQAPLPTGADAPSAHPDVSFRDESCSSATSCVAVGSYAGTSTGKGLIDTLSNGTWTAVAPPLPSNAGAGSASDMESVSCPSDGWCVAVGTYQNASGRQDSFIDTLSGGQWTSMEAPVPSDAQPETSADTFLKSVDCPGVGDCTAFGAYKNAHGTGNPVGFLDTFSKNAWTAQTAPQPAGADAMQFVVPVSVSCPAMGPCAAVATYTNASSNAQAELLTQSGAGTWTAQDAPLPSDAATAANESSFMDDVSCATGVCVAGGGYNDTSLKEHGLLERLSGGAWTATSSPEPANAGTGSNQTAQIFSVSCTFDGCVGAGDYRDSAGRLRALINAIDASGAVTAAEGPQPSDAATGSSVNASFNSVSCLSLNQCTAVGAYHNTTSSTDVALIDSGSGTSWTNTQAPVPSNAATGATAQSTLDAISCPVGGACEAAGNYSDPDLFGLLESFTPAEGYWTDASDGGVFTYGSAVFHGSAGNLVLNKPVVGMAPTPGDGGYWLVASDGGIFSYGDAGFHGSAGALHLNKPVVGMAAAPDGGGYWSVASDGGIFNYGSAGFYGSTGALHLNAPVVGMAATPDGRGYWLVATDGGIFSYGDAAFFGSRGGQPLNKPIVGMAATPDGLGYWLVASDGGIFTYGDAAFHGSTGAIVLNKPVVGMFRTFDGAGYWLVASDGGIFSYGDTGFYGSTGAIVLNKPMVGGAAS